MTDKRAAGRRLLFLREANGLSRRDLADRLGVDRSAVAAWEAGRYLPRAERLSALADALGTPREHLLAPQRRTRPHRSSAPSAWLVDTVEDLPGVLLDLTRKARLLRAFRLAAPYPTSAYVQTEWRAMVAQRILAGSLEVQRVEIVYELARLKEIVSNILRYDGCKYYVKSFCCGMNGVAPAMGGYMFDDEEFLLGAYWTGIPPTHKPGLRMACEPFASFFAAYWSEIWGRGTPLNMRGRHDLSEAQKVAIGLGLESARWAEFVDEAQSLEIGDGAPPLI